MAKRFAGHLILRIGSPAKLNSQQNIYLNISFTIITEVIQYNRMSKFQEG